MSQLACPSCGALNPVGFGFCGSCGSSLERVVPDLRGRRTRPATASAARAGLGLGETPEASRRIEERKVVTMLFADLTASTEMASRLDPEDLRAVLRPFFDAMTEEIDRYGGTVEKFIGDAIVAAFGAPGRARGRSRTRRSGARSRCSVGCADLNDAARGAGGRRTLACGSASTPAR